MAQPIFTYGKPKNLPTGAVVVKVDAQGNPLEPVPAGYTPQSYYKNYKVNWPVSKPQQTAQGQQYLTPENWNYKNPPINPETGRSINMQGMALPEGAQGWTPYGEPYFGPGIAGYLKGAWWRITQAPVSQQELQRTVAQSGGAATGAAIGTALLPGGGTVLGALVGGGVGGFLGATAVEKQELKITQAKPNVLNMFTRLPGEAFKGVGEAFTQMARWYEEYAGGANLGLIAAGEGAEMPAQKPVKNPYVVGTPSDNYFVRLAQNARNTAFDIANVFFAGNPLSLAYNAIRMYESPKSWDEKEALFNRNFQAGKIAYTAFSEPAVQEEFIRRVQSGEDPQLLVMELQNPGKEFAGQIIWDPLNIIGPALGKVIKGVKYENEISNLMKVADGDVEKAIVAMKGVGSEARGAQVLTDLVEADGKAVAATRAGLVRMERDYSLLAMPSTAKNIRVGRDAVELVNWTIHNQRESDVLDVFTALAKTASEDVNVRTAGVDTLMRARAPQLYFSEAANRMKVILHDVMLDEAGTYNPEKFIKGFTEIQKTGDTAKMADYLGARMSKVLDSMFPSVPDMAKAAKGTELAARYEQLPGWVKTISKFDNTAKGKIWGPANKFFTNVYMALSPGYAFRNAIQNTFHVFVDLGPTAAKEAGIAQIKSFFSPKSGLERSVKQIENYLGYVSEEATKGYGIQAAAEVQGGAKWSMLTKSQDMEAAASAVIYSKSVEQTMRAMLKPGRALPDLDFLLSRGWDRPTAELLQNLVIDNYGSVDKAAAAFTKATADGTFEVFRNIHTWIDKNDMGFMKDAQLFDHVRDIVKNAKTEEEATAGFQKLLDDIILEAKKVAKESAPLVVDGDEDLLKTSTILGKANESGALSNITADLAGRQDLANKAVFERLDTISADLGTSAHKVFVDAQNPEMAQKVNVLYNGYRQQANQLKDAARAEYDALTPEVWKVSYAVKGAKKATAAELEAMWNSSNLTRWQKAPIGKSSETFLGYLWDEFWRPKRTQIWTDAREGQAAMTADYLSQLSDLTGVDYNMNPQLWKAADELRLARQWDTAVPRGNHLFYPLEGVSLAKEMPAWKVAKELGIDNQFMADRHLLNSINKRLPKEQQFGRLEEVPEDIARQALESRMVEKPALVTTPPEELPLGKEPLPTVHNPSAQPTYSRMLYEQLPEIRAMFGRVTEGLHENWGKTVEVISNKAITQGMKEYLASAGEEIAVGRLKAATVARATRDFALLNYGGKRYFDLALAYIFPYQFWYSRTYANWMQRLVMAPEVIAAYAKYKNLMAAEHANMPEWWKYNINTNELLGLDAKHPLNFNLEALLNPLNGITGIDFEDPYKRVDWFSTFIDDMAKMGPTVWTPIQIALAAYYNQKGEDDAASRWGGRLIPQTATLKSLTALMNIGPKGGLEIDPSVWFFSGGLDAYERKRVGRALGAMVQDGTITEAQQIDAGNAQSGPIWEEAMQRATEIRGPGQLMSFFGGVGLKARNPSDIEIDKFYQDYKYLWAMEPLLKKEELQQGLEQLRQRYPFMDGLLLSRKGGVDRDRAFAYNVLSRISPAQSDDVAKAVGLDPQMLNQFYDSKGHMEDWAQTDRDKFMAGMAEIGALLNVPDQATRAEWMQAKDAYSTMNEQAKATWGADILDRVDAYYGQKGDTQAEKNAAERLLANDPAIEQYLDWKAQVIVNDDLLNSYYGGIDTIRNYYKGVMYQDIENQLGKGIWDLWSQYWILENTGYTKEANAFYKANQVAFKKYTEIKKSYGLTIDYEILRAGSQIQEGKPMELRQDIGTMTTAQQGLAQYVQNYQATPQFTWQEFQSVLIQPLQDLIVGAYTGYQTLPDEARTQLATLARQMNMTEQELEQMIYRSLDQLR